MSTVFYKKLITFFKLFLTHIWFEKDVTNDKAPNIADGSVLCFIKNEGYNVNLFFDYIEEGRTMYLYYYSIEMVAAPFLKYS